jgi:hypothetical protein
MLKILFDLLIFLTNKIVNKNLLFIYEKLKKKDKKGATYFADTGPALDPVCVACVSVKRTVGVRVSM